MNLAEHTVWAIMTGGLLSLVLLAATDTLVTRSLGAVRNMLLIFVISSACIFLSGLPQTLFPGLPERLVMALKAGFGLLSSALGLRLLGIWTGGDREDHLVYRITVWGAYGMLIASLVMTVLATLVPVQDFLGLLMLTAGLNAIAVVLCMVIAVRAALLGDPLARWLVLACVLLTILMAGLYLHALDVAGLGLGLRILTASSAVLFVLIVMVLIIVRNRQQRQLVRLSRLEMGWDPVTGLPTGAKLLSEVEHAFWRTGRLRGQCIVVALYLNNLYGLGDTLGRTSDHQILAATAARIRRAAGFRCVVGLYHPRCFIVVFSIDRKRHFDGAFVTRLQGLVTKPLQVVGSKAQRLPFVPQVGIALRTVLPDQTVAQDVIDAVEHEAMEQVRRPAVPEDGIDTTW
jgi:GGDEF domain-containing protein